MKYKPLLKKYGFFFGIIFLFLLLEKHLILRDGEKSQYGKSQEKNNNIPSKLFKIMGISKCSQNPHKLRGNLKLDLEKLTMTSLDDIAKANPGLGVGGQFSPKDCIANYRVAIIIPLRDREEQLSALLGHMHPIWQRQLLNYTVYTITQSGKELFNRGKLMNIGYVEANKEREYDCFVFHDVDILLENDECTYYCTDTHTHVKHLSAYIGKFNYTMRRYQTKCLPAEYPFSEIVNFGGITSITGGQFQDINGFPNIYWGWGGEDDDMALRVWKKGYKVTRPEECRYTMLDHDKAERNSLKNLIRNSSLLRQNMEGLNTLRYEVVSRELHPLYTNISVDLGAPSEKMLKLSRDKKEKGNCDGMEFVGMEE